MAFTRAYTQRELDTIRAKWKTSSAKELADELGRSERGIYKKIKDMHLREDDAAEGQSPMQESPENGEAMQPKAADFGAECIGRKVTDMDRLAGLRDLIWKALLGAEPSDIAKLAPEYRKTIEEMIQIDGGRTGGTEDGGGGSLAEVIRL